MTTDSFLSWFSSKGYNFLDSGRAGEYLNYKEVEQDLDNARSYLESNSPDNKKKGALKGFDNIRDNFLKPELTEDVDDFNRIKQIDINSTSSVTRTRDINVSRYLDTTIQTKARKIQNLNFEIRSSLNRGDTANAVNLKGEPLTDNEKARSIIGREPTPREIIELKDSGRLNFK